MLQRKDRMQETERSARYVMRPSEAALYTLSMRSEQSCVGAAFLKRVESRSGQTSLVKRAAAAEATRNSERKVQQLGAVPRERLITKVVVGADVRFLRVICYLF